MAFFASSVFSAVTYAEDEKQEIVVITNANNPVEKLEKRQIIDLFMGKYIAFSDGRAAAPMDLDEESEIKSKFYKKLVGMPLARVNAYWSRIKFTGRATPPIAVNSIEEIDKMLSEQGNVVAYIYASQVTDKMKVVYRFD